MYAGPLGTAIVLANDEVRAKPVALAPGRLIGPKGDRATTIY
jgi:hypothetical protein